MSSPGRPRAFDRDKALQDAMLLFWRQGYLATSMNDLCEAMHIRSPSLYAAFGSKEDLYLEAVKLYTRDVRPMLWSMLRVSPQARVCMQQFLEEAARLLPKSGDAPVSCMVTLSGLHEGAPVPVAEALRQARLDGLEAICDRLAEARASGDVPPTTDVNRLGRFFLAVFQGMAIQAQDGASSEELGDMARNAMAAWPDGA